MRIGDVTSASASTSMDRVQRSPRNKEMDAKALEVIADKLGVSSDDLKTRLKSGEKLDDIVEAAGLTKEDIRTALQDAARKSGASQPPPPPPPAGGSDLDPAVAEKVTEVLADKLGISSDDLLTKLGSGETLDDIFSEQGLNQDDLQSALEDAFKALQPYDQSGTQQSGAWLAGSQQVDVRV